MAEFDRRDALCLGALCGMDAASGGIFGACQRSRAHTPQCGRDGCARVLASLPLTPAETPQHHPDGRRISELRDVWIPHSRRRIVEFGRRSYPGVRGAWLPASRNHAGS
jgi:hypothetical protein